MVYINIIFLSTLVIEKDYYEYDGDINTQGYQRYFLQLGVLIRIFTLLRSNQI